MSEETEPVLKAIELFQSGYNCSQSVLCSRCEEFGMPHEQGRMLASGFGGGISGLRRTCGALTGAVMLLGLKYGDYDPNNRELKYHHYQRAKDLEKKFSEKFGTSICKELLLKAKVHFEDSPMARTEEYYATRPCAVFVAYACELFAKAVAGAGIEG